MLLRPIASRTGAVTRAASRAWRRAAPAASSSPSSSRSGRATMSSGTRTPPAKSKSQHSHHHHRRRASSASASATSSPSPSPDFRFGLLADIQYTDTDDRTNFTGTQVRRYRNSLAVASDAIAFFNRYDDLSFVLHNGDIIDHQCAFDFETDAFKPKRVSYDHLGEVMRVLDDSACKEWVFTVGNHELYNFTRDELRDGVRGTNATTPLRCAHPETGSFYYAMRPARGWKVIVLDAYDVSVYGNGRGEGLDRAAVELLCEHNPNCARWVEDNPDVFETERMSGTFPYFQGLEGLGTRWVPFNGAVSEAQLRWLREELIAAKASEERVVVFSHLLVHPASTAKGSGRTLLWNYDAVLAVLEDDAYAANVSAVVSGHQHEGGLHTSEAGTHYVVMESPMLATPGRKGPWCVVEARGDSIDFVGYGRGPESKVFPDDMAGEEGVGDVEDAAPSVRRLPLRPVG